MAARGFNPRKPRGRGEWVAAALVALAAATVLVKTAVAAGTTVLQGWPVIVPLTAAGAVYAAWRAFHARQATRIRAANLARLRVTLTQIDTMNDREFEEVLRDLLIRDGWSARRVGQQGDQAADVIGTHRQRGRIVIQAKHTTVAGKVTSSVMYQVKGTAGPVHGAETAVVVTNGSFTRDAQSWGQRYRVHWIDRDRLRTWAEGGTPLHDLLRRPHRYPGRTAGHAACPPAQ